MNFFKKKEKELTGKEKTEQILAQRENLKVEIAAKLYQKGFSDDDVETVIDVIERAEEDIKEIKDSLIDTNINPTGDPAEPLYNGVNKIKQRQLEMQQELTKTIQELSKKY